mmetsp:Transcript_32228/g.94203  ORF Transcript_32228/g.94203 Transcript_32228/m.94203 type:complete len:693 (+) Transcript_32228:80-2158(+)
MPPVLRLSQFRGSRGSQVEEPDRLPPRPTAAPRVPPVLVLRNVQPAKVPEGFHYHAGTTAVVSETEHFVEVSDGPPGSGLTMGERRSHDGTWTERFVHQCSGAAPGGAGQGKGSPKGKGKGTMQPCDHGRRMGKNSALGQRYKETWQRVQDPDGSCIRTKVERHVQEVEDVDAGDDTAIHQEWSEDEEVWEPAAGDAAARASGSSSSSSQVVAPSKPTDREVLSSRTWTQKGKDRRTGRTWSRAITRRKVRVREEVMSESEEETLEVEADGGERGNSRHRLGRSISTKEWGAQANGNRWRSTYILQTLVNPDGEVRGRESVHKWYDNGQEEQTEEWETLDEFEQVLVGDSSRLRLKRRIRSGRKDGRQHTGQCTEWHERWEETEVPESLTLRLQKKKVEKWWRENACNNAWGEHQIDNIGADGNVERTERRKWYDNGTERQDESWTENADGSAEGTKEGTRAGESWGERWRRTCAGDEGAQTVEKWHDDGLGKKVESKEGKRWQGSKDVEWHREELGEVVGQNQNWTVKTGGNAQGDEWFESWAERQAEKTAEKRGKNAAGDEWREAWVEEYDAEGIRIRHQAEKQGSNARGDAWYEQWIEEQEKKKSAVKHGKNADGAEWHEEWGEQAGEDGSGVKWTSKWADDGSGNRWGNSWGDQWGSSGQGGKRWVEDWDNKGKLEKHCHGTHGRPDH